MASWFGQCMQALEAVNQIYHVNIFNHQLLILRFEKFKMADGVRSAAIFHFRLWERVGMSRDCGYLGCVKRGARWRRSGVRRSSRPSWQSSWRCGAADTDPRWRPEADRRGSETCTFPARSFSTMIGWWRHVGNRACQSRDLVFNFRISYL
jgi:hypothetical protein